jgi:hypothetical protein
MLGDPEHTMKRPDTNGYAHSDVATLHRSLIKSPLV